MTIRIRNLVWEGPWKVGTSVDCPDVGLYIILCQETDNRYRVIYVGQSSEVNERIDSSHHKWDCFFRECPEPLFAYYPMPDSIESERTEKEEHVLQQRKDLPPCNA